MVDSGVDGGPRPAPVDVEQKEGKELLNKKRVALQAALLLDGLKPVQGVPLDLSSVKQRILDEKKPPEATKITNGSRHERDEFWKKEMAKEKDSENKKLDTFEKRRDRWIEGTNKFLAKYKKDKPEDAEKPEALILQRLGISVDKAADVYEEYFVKNKGDIGYFAMKVATELTGDEIKDNTDLLTKIGNFYGKDSSEVATLLSEGIKNVKDNFPEFENEARLHFNEQMDGLDIINGIHVRSNVWEKKEVARKALEAKLKAEAVAAAEKRRQEEEAERKKSESPEAGMYGELKKKGEEAKRLIYVGAQNKDEAYINRLKQEVGTILEHGGKFDVDKLEKEIQDANIKPVDLDFKGKENRIYSGKDLITVDFRGAPEAFKKALEKSNFFEEMESGKKSIRIIQWREEKTGLLAAVNPEEIEIMRLLLELKRRYPKNVVLELETIKLENDKPAGESSSDTTQMPGTTDTTTEEVRPPMDIVPKEEIVEFKNGHLALRFRGAPDTQLDFTKWKHKYNPFDSSLANSAIVSTKSGKEYYIAPDANGIYIVDIAETLSKGQLVAAYNVEPPPIEWGKPWDIPELGKTDDVKELLVKYLVVSPGAGIGRELNIDDPFVNYKTLLANYIPSDK